MPEQLKKAPVAEPKAVEPSISIRELKELFNDRFVKLTEAANNATNIWQHTELTHRIAEVTELYKTIVK